MTTRRRSGRRRRVIIGSSTSRESHMRTGGMTDSKQKGRLQRERILHPLYSWITSQRYRRKYRRRDQGRAADRERDQRDWAQQLRRSS